MFYNTIYALSYDKSIEKYKKNIGRINIVKNDYVY